jgi:hypothetical protein
MIFLWSSKCSEDLRRCLTPTIGLVRMRVEANDADILALGRDVLVGIIKEAV